MERSRGWLTGLVVLGALSCSGCGLLYPYPNSASPYGRPYPTAPGYSAPGYQAYPAQPGYPAYPGTMTNPGYGGQGYPVTPGYPMMTP